MQRAPNKMPQKKLWNKNRKGSSNESTHQKVELWDLRRGSQSLATGAGEKGIPPLRFLNAETSRLPFCILFTAQTCTTFCFRTMTG